ncbi:nucleoside/nucleotide kinase family protein [Phytoactinopolyspora halotolerans]|uniref:Nucleoside/nucleotide kinase family protein n=1 Tax=Phytoactinopolyspora halotolerans TaxID=1981512 RepID=A0A6L9S4C7_9ACTN|nr:nucleoside/nucleotide kinase family protein [Phytoactinopolyspora halotolerans]NED99985.1 nucleoside/nucleotide kinase family protein [Phytoactinopolyspora halotolerans]
MARAQEYISLSGTGAALAELAARAHRPGRRRLIGVAGVPGAGKSTFAVALARAIGPAAVQVPMDGFHLADVELERLGRRDRKGAPDTFDAYGYASLLSRIQARPSHVVYAPGFERDLEQPIAASLPVGPEPEVVVTEGNYLLLDQPGWREARACLDEVWYVETDDEVRSQRLVERHIRFGKSPDEAAVWVQAVDSENARLVEKTRLRADLRIDLSAFQL